MRKLSNIKSSRAIGAISSVAILILTICLERVGAASVESLVLGNNPMAYWHLNESSGATVAVDAIGAFNAAYGTTSILGNPGPRSPAYPGFASTNTAAGTALNDANSVITIPPLNLNTNTMTVIAWINAASDQDPYATLLGWRDSSGAGYGLLAYGGQVGWIWNNYGWWEVTGLTIPTNQWCMAAVVVTETNGTIYLGAGGSLNTYISPNPNASAPFDTSCTLGAEPNGTRVFNGLIDEVAIFSHSLTSEQIQAIYAAGVGQVPVNITQPPTDRASYAGGTARFSVGATGSNPAYQWKKGTTILNNGGNISGAQSANLTIANVSASDAGSYSCAVSNALGGAMSSSATLAVLPTPTNAFDRAILGYRPLAYWQLNETNGSGITADYWGGFDGTPLSSQANLGVPGPRPPTFSGFRSDNTALQSTAGVGVSSVAVPAVNLNANTATIVMWIYPVGNQASYTSMFANRSGGYMAINYNDDALTLSYQWDSFGWDSTILIPSDQWSLAALVITPTNTTVYLGNNGTLTNSTQVIDNPVLSFAGTSWIGSDSGNDTRVFNGVIDDVAFFNRSLSPADMAVIYGSAFGQAPPPATLNWSITASGLVLTWFGPWTLMQADSVSGPWSAATDVTLGVPIPMTAAKRFYRLQF